LNPIFPRCRKGGQTKYQISAGVAAVDKQNELMGLKIKRLESKRVDEFANMSDEELREFVYGNKEFDS
jgi:hypothetical protein